MGQSSQGRSGRRGAPLKVLEDRTPLNGDRVDIATRVAWLLRTARLSAPATRGLPQYAMVERLRETGLAVSRNWVHRLEAGDLRSGLGAEGYEKVLGLAPGRLRATIDLVCRSGPVSPPDSDPGALLDDVVAISAATDAVLVDRPTGWQWFTWARQFSRPEVRGLRVQVARALIERLCSELCRSVDAAYDSRYEALAAIRSGPYGDLVVEAARAEIADPHVQSVIDLISAVAEVVDDAAREFCTELVGDARAHVALAGAHGVENLLAATGAGGPEWARLGAAVAAAFDRAEPDSDLAAGLAHALRLLAARRVPLPTVSRPLPPTVEADVPARGATAEQWSRCQRLAADIGAGLGLGPDPMLARLLFDLLVGRSGNSAFASSRLLSALPFAPQVVAHVLAFAEAETEPALRRRMVQRIASVAGAQAPEGVGHWLEDADLRPAALVLLAHGGVQPDGALLRSLLAVPDAWSRALYAAGMTGHPLLTEAAATGQPAHVAGAARWWLRHGTRVVDPVPAPPD
ncbi:MAG TPA: hypothetical protein VFO98_10945 [Marmoricola sp.]|nr:hypothetical protein [Marmoricola sp.]